MTLLAPLLMLGMVALGLPIAAHLLGRQTPKPIRFAAMRFLSPAEPSVTPRRRLQDWPLLLVRLLLLLVLVLALARPASTDATGMAVVGEPHDAVILIDASRSMELQIDEQTLLQHAGERAISLLDALPAGSRVGLSWSDPGAPVVALDADPDRVRAAIEDWIARGGPRPGAPRPGAWTLAEAMPRAMQQLRDADADRVHAVYAVGDGTERGLGSLPKTAAAGTLVIPIPAVEAGTAEPEHVGIDELQWEAAPQLDPRAIRVRAMVTRHAAGGEATPADVLEREVVLRIGDTEVARATVDLPADEPQVVEFTHTLLDADDQVPATVELVGEGDPLPSDDRRATWLAADDALEVVVVNGDPSELRAHDEVFFLATAVGASEEQRRMHLRSLAPDQLTDRVQTQGAKAFDDVDVLVLANVRAPSVPVALAIAERVRRGMGLWISVGDRVEADVYNSRFDALLPLRMREPIVVGTAPGRAEARVEGLAPADLSHPAFAGLSGDLGLSGSRARRIMLLDPDPTRRPQIALSFSSGAPALLTREVDDGRVALLTTSVDRDWADLPLRPGFVPLVANVLGYLADTRRGVAGSRLLVGETRSIRTDGPITVRLPDGRSVSLSPDDDGAAVLRDTWLPGHYRAGEGDAAVLLAVVVDPAESITATVEVAPVELGTDEQVEISVPRWRELLLVALLLLGLEAVLRSRRRS
jgi:hypothetical protein